MPEAPSRYQLLAAGADYGEPRPEWLEVEWDRRLRRMKLPGAAVDYVEVGEGEPIIFVHGLSGCWQNWLENLPHFGGARRAMALDLPGCGASPMPSWPIDMAAYGRLLGEFCEKLEIESATLVGNSMGGLAALEAVTMSPGRFNRLVLVSAAGILNTWRPEARAALFTKAWDLLSGRIGSAATEIVARPRSRQLLFGRFMHDPGRLREDLLWEQLVGGAPCPAFGDALRAVIRSDIRARLGEIKIPTLIVWGFSDRVIPVQAALSYHRRIPRSRLEIFERTGHLPQLERPARFNAVLDDFLDVSW
jgi:pimeloyl-ACP methyl ester carboxylesterase